MDNFETSMAHRWWNGLYDSEKEKWCEKIKKSKGISIDYKKPTDNQIEILWQMFYYETDHSGVF